MSELIYEEDNGKYPYGTVTISQSEYRDLLDTQARSSILHAEMLSILDDTLEKQKDKQFGNIYSVKNADISIERMSNIMGFYSTFKGALDRERKYKETLESEEE